MIVTRTPLRISFVGGGSDLEAFYSRHAGAVLSATIDKFVYVVSHPGVPVGARPALPARARYSGSDATAAPVLEEALRRLDADGRLVVEAIADVAAGTGLGFSSAYTVGLLHNLRARLGDRGVDARRLAEEAFEIENRVLGEPIGKQDQYAAAFGGANVLRFAPSGAVGVEPVAMEPATRRRLESGLVLVDTGIRRTAAPILRRQAGAMREDGPVAAVLRMVALVDELRRALARGDVERVGPILDEDWSLKRGLAPGITNDRIDGIYRTAVANGALGGKLLGAGGGGFLLLYCIPGARKRLLAALSPLRELRFRLHGQGSRLVVSRG
jgi:D-glycero-alpha-D-manno-heptose-7-phosphate kinase